MILTVRPVRGPQELHVAHLDRVAAADRAGHPGHRVRLAAAVQRGTGVVDVHAVEGGREPVRVAFPADLAVGDDVQAGPLLGPDGQFGRVALGLLQVVRGHPPQLAGPDPGREPAAQPRPVDQPVRLRVTADQGGGEEHDSHNVRLADGAQPGAVSSPARAARLAV